MKTTELVITHSDNDGSQNADAVVECPHCGERYKYNAPFMLEVGETFMKFCDGEEGCEEEFEVIVK